MIYLCGYTKAETDNFTMGSVPITGDLYMGDNVIKNVGELKINLKI